MVIAKPVPNTCRRFVIYHKVQDRKGAVLLKVLHDQYNDLKNPQFGRE
jgi:hypothetical protein